MNGYGTFLFQDDEHFQALELYRKYHSANDLAKETGLSASYCHAIFRNPKAQRFSRPTMVRIQDAILGFRERLGKENMENSKIVMDKYHNSHLKTVFDKSPKEILKEYMVKDIISMIQDISYGTLVNLYNNTLAYYDDDKERKIEDKSVHE